MILRIQIRKLCFSQAAFFVAAQRMLLIGCLSEKQRCGSLHNANTPSIRIERRVEKN